ncbi:MAG: hypothetical protein OEL75_04530, partial [Kiritimatiellaceae bacterium]|nr:hypothetical protein [Kiritimatiellaceae bacterium]
MRKLAMGITTLLYLASQSGLAETIITAQDYAVDSDVVLEMGVEEVKSTPQDTVDFIGDAVKFVSDETATAIKGIASITKRDLVAEHKKAASLQTANAWDTSDDIIFRSYKVTD